MAMEKEALVNKIEDDLAKRNRNWGKIDDHLADYATFKSGLLVQDISSSLTTIGITNPTKSVFKMGNIVMVSVGGTATQAIAGYTALATLSGHRVRATRFFHNINNKSYVWYANSSNISTRVPIAKGEDITFSIITILE